MSETDLVLRGDKNAAIILAISELYGVSVPQAVNLYYQSETSQLIEDKVSDLHCRSDRYLASVVWDEK